MKATASSLPGLFFGFSFSFQSSAVGLIIDTSILFLTLDCIWSFGRLWLIGRSVCIIHRSAANQARETPSLGISSSKVLLVLTPSSVAESHLILD